MTHRHTQRVKTVKNRKKSKTKQLHYYLVQAKSQPFEVDCMQGCVVKCHSVKRARQLAQENGSDETHANHYSSRDGFSQRQVQYWTRSDKATCRRLAHPNETDTEEMILMDVLNG
jgi:hypothetical protein